MRGLLAVTALLAAGAATAEDLVIPLAGAGAVSRQVIQYRCDPGASALGLPRESFPVLYLNAGDNHLAVIKIGGKSMIFANVFAGSGARYAGGLYVWWDAAGRDASLSVELPEKRTVQCRRVSPL